MRALSAWAAGRPTSTFFVLAYAIAWLAWAPLVLSRTGIGLLPFDLPLWSMLPGSYAPLLAAVIVQRLSSGNCRIGDLVPYPGAALISAVLGCLLVAVGFVILPGLWLGGGVVRSFEWAAFAVYPYGVLRAALMAGPVGEEPGWRGFALPRLQHRYGPLRAALLLGLLWALWHAPLFLVPSWNGTAPWVYFLLVGGFGFVMSLCFNLSRNSILVAILLHAVFNASSGVLGRFLAHTEITGEIRPDLVLAGSFAVVAVLIVLATRGRLGLALR
ncbi:CPBP family intramembrane glutamic endopeptidase [Tahibacter caeni]|uniref:CPBP family intramembrane glutamic endopeptidase n=1 Tax=Tahibacter caeni TaxID=1453545 RepID=UPI002148DF33|nr:CPBP family intramembrane glutamic endopeptidase [Tahibacter caeni]